MVAKTQKDGYEDEAQQHNCQPVPEVMDCANAARKTQQCRSIIKTG